MLKRPFLAMALLSAIGLTPAAGRGQLVSMPRAFQTYARGDQIVVHWLPASDADTYVGQVDDDLTFASAFQWSFRDDGRASYDVPVRVSAPGLYYVRMRALRSFLIVSLQSDWTLPQRVVVGARGAPVFWPGTAPFGASAAAGLPLTVEPGPYPGDLWLTWGSVPGAGSYVLQLASDGSFLTPYSFTVGAVPVRPTQVLLIRNVPRARYYVRVQPVRTAVRRSVVVWSSVRVVDLSPGKVTIVRREVNVRNVRQIEFARAVRVVPASGTGHGVGKGHLQHVGKPDTPGHARGPDHWNDD